MTTTKASKERVTRAAVLKWVPLALMNVSPLAQRDLNWARVDRIAADLDVEQIGALTVNRRSDGRFFIIDGQHRAEALRVIGYDDQQIQCWVYEGLTEEQEAEMFLKLNDTLAVPALARFRIAVEAGREMETAINNIVEKAGCKVSAIRVEGHISAVGTLIRIYRRSDGATLARTIRIIYDSFGTRGLDADVLDGIGFLCARYETELDDEWTVERLNKLRGGVNGLRGRAEAIRQRTGLSRGQSTAAAAVDIINIGRGGKKLVSWFRED